jgi:type IV pilus assembly protein PilA
MKGLNIMKCTSYKRNSGFTIIELLIVIAIVGILAAIAVPTYLAYTKKAYFAEVVQATGPYKLAVEECYQALGGGTAVANCANGQNGVPAAPASTGNVGSITTTAAGVITATGSALHSLTTETYILTPTPTSGVLIWAITGQCVTDGVCQ